jgi:hypothetical protein
MRVSWLVSGWGQSLPKDFDVSLPETWAIISSKDKVLNIVAAAKGSLGEVSIQGTKEETGWEFTAGIDLAASNLSRVYKPLAAFDDFVGLTDIVMILSSRAAPDFDFPDTDQAQAIPVSVHGTADGGVALAEPAVPVAR